MGEPVDEERVVALLCALMETHRHIEALLGAPRFGAAIVNRAMARSDDVMRALLRSEGGTGESGSG
jgi:hypothetical protein